MSLDKELAEHFRRRADADRPVAVYLMPSELRVIAAALERAYVQNAWISIKEHKPEGDGSVLCTGLDPDGGRWIEIVSASWLRNDAPGEFVTHWMPRPDTSCISSQP